MFVFSSVHVYGPGTVSMSILRFLEHCHVTKGALRIDTEREYFGDGSRWKIIKIPNFGMHRIRFRDRSIWVSITEESMEGTREGKQQHVVLSTFWYQKHLLDLLLEEAIAEERLRCTQTIVVYQNDAGSKRFSVRKRYSPQALCMKHLPILPNGVTERILEDVRSFLNAKERYLRSGIPYRRGYLFEGLPGSGKTTLVRRIAAEFILPIYVVMLQHCSDVIQLLSNVNERSIILFEDIDVAFGTSDSDSRSMNHSRTKTTFSDLFNALDGVVAQTDSLVIMTTNHVEKLDPAMIRPGRIDVREHFSHVKASEAEKAYVLFVGHEKGAREFGENAEQMLWTMADVQKELLMTPNDN